MYHQYNELLINYVDNNRDPDRSMAFGIDHILHARRLSSCLDNHRHHFDRRAHVARS